MCHANTSHRKAKVARTTLISDKVDFRAQKITRDRERHYMIVTVYPTLHKIVIQNMFAPNNRSAKYVKQKLVKTERKTS